MTNMDLHKTLSIGVDNEIDLSNESELKYFSPYCFYCSAYTNKLNFGHLGNKENTEHHVIEDPFCHFVKNINKLNDNQAVIAYIPDISSIDIVRLQRSVFIALRGDDKEKKKEAIKIQNWLISHKKYTEEYLYTSSPEQISKAFFEIDKIANKNEIDAFFSKLHVIYVDYSIFNEYENGIKNNTKQYPFDMWDNFLKKIK